MAASVVNSTSGRGNGSGPFVSGAFDSTSGNALLVQIREAGGQGNTQAPTDNVVGSPNVYTLIALQTDTNAAQMRLYRCDSIVGRTGMVISIAYPGGSGDSSFGVVEIAGSTGYSSALSAIGANGAQPWTRSSGTPLAVGDLAIAAMTDSGGLQTITFAAPFTKLAATEENDGGSYWPGSMAEATSAGTGALAASVTSTAGIQAALGVLIYPASTGGGTSPTTATPAAGEATVSGTARSLATTAATPAAGSAAVSASARSAVRVDAVPAAGVALVSATTPQSESGAAVWSYVLSNGKSAGQNLVEINAVLTGPIEGDIDMAGAIRVLLAVAAGKTSIVTGAPGTATVEFRAVDDSETRVVADMVGSERVDVTITP